MRILTITVVLLAVGSCSFSHTGVSRSLIYKNSYIELHCLSTPSSTEIKVNPDVLKVVPTGPVLKSFEGMEDPTVEKIKTLTKAAAKTCMKFLDR